MAHRVREYEPLLKRLTFTVSLLVAVLGFPVAIGCLMYVIGASRWGAMLGGATMIYFPMVIAMAIGSRQRRKMYKAFGGPLQPGDRIEVVSGPLKGRRGVVELHGQGGPLTLYVVMDDSPDESIVFNWHRLRRAS